MRRKKDDFKITHVRRAGMTKMFLCHQCDRMGLIEIPEQLCQFVPDELDGLVICERCESGEAAQ